MGGTRHNGFTLMEMMMALAVIGVVVAITIPNFQTFLLNNRMTGAANDLLAAVNVARSEAIKRQRTVGICTSTDPDAAQPSCTNELDDVGSIGWAVWLDTDRDAALDAGEEVLVRHDPLAALTLSTNWQAIAYAPTGFPEFTPALAEGAPATILLCDQRGNAAAGEVLRRRIMTVSRTGRPAILRTATDAQALDDALAELVTPPRTQC